MDSAVAKDFYIRKLGEALIEKELISPIELKKALEKQRKTGKRLGEILIEEKLLSEDTLLEILSQKLNIPKVKIENQAVDSDTVQLIPYEIAKKHKLIPLFRVGNSLTIAMADPLDIYAIDTVRHLTGMQIKVVLAGEKDVEQAIEKFYGGRHSLDEVIRELKDQEEETQSVETLDSTISQADTETGASVVKIVNLILNQAISEGASDIHIEPDFKITRIRYRIDGILHDAFTPPKSLHNMIVARIKIMAELDVSEKRLPQDGGFQYRLNNKSIDLRVSILPTVRGEKVVMRILDKSSFLLKIEQMGFSESVRETWLKLIKRSQGMILITGPTGSGKTTTLYAALNHINTPDKNIITVENPVEYNFPRINQVEVNVKAGLTFSAGLRSILRQDPDIIMIGEIRDLESAEIAVRAALTGHLVLTTLHTNDAPSAVTRLIDMGVEPFLVASSVQSVLAQRLVRTICNKCKQPYQLSPEMLEQLNISESFKSHTFYRGAGCRKCHYTGYKGRTAIHELLVIDDEIRRLIVQRASEDAIRDVGAKNGMVSLRQDGLLKAMKGVLSVEEVLRVT
ncbi:type II secretion system protein GspE [candidate division KSB1 bacterium]|nr:MAG: type II secretion system protein GspE [candidate division KSB1 bacterium]RKY88495.1 MAG: type II secretion system protein GspE [candidate division KSB1 bacterium]RKY92248.1 MAG: type II secretion system protein GspE [candidate division KSB1 bacterium]